MRTTSPDALAAIFGEETDDPFLQLLHLKDTASSEEVFLVNNTLPITHKTQPYQPTRFTLSLPDEEDGTLQKVQLVMDNTTQQLGQLVETIVFRPEATITFIRASVPDDVEWGPFVFSIESVHYDASQVTATLMYLDITTRRYPQHGYNPGHTPELY